MPICTKIRIGSACSAWILYGREDEREARVVGKTESRGCCALSRVRSAIGTPIGHEEARWELLCPRLYRCGGGRRTDREREERGRGKNSARVSTIPGIVSRP